MGKVIKLFLIALCLFFSNTIFLMKPKPEPKLERYKLLENAIREGDYNSFIKAILPPTKMTNKLIDLMKKSKSKKIRNFAIGFIAFLEACQKGDLKKIKELERTHRDLNIDFIFWHMMIGPEGEWPWGIVLEGNKKLIARHFISSGVFLPPKDYIFGMLKNKPNNVVFEIALAYAFLDCVLECDLQKIITFSKKYKDLIKDIINVKDEYLDTPLHKLLHLFNERRKIDRKKEMEYERKKGITSFDYNADVIDLKKEYPSVYKIAKILIENGADIYMKNFDQDSPDSLAKKIDEGLVSFTRKTNIQEVLRKFWRIEETKKMLRDMENRKKPLNIKKVYLDVCPACQSKLDLKNTLVFSPCGHTIHRNNPDAKAKPCFIGAYEATGLCPICRGKIEGVEKLERLKGAKKLLEQQKPKKPKKLKIKKEEKIESKEKVKKLKVELKNLESQKKIFKKRIESLKKQTGKGQQIKFLEGQVSGFHERMVKILDILAKAEDENLRKPKKKRKLKKMIKLKKKRFSW
ncbi:hypothetical protein ACFLYU_01755 [Candidatus Dependentiae bacterium]